MENKIVIGKIFVPKNAVPDFLKQLHISKNLLQNVVGIVKQEFFEHTTDSGDIVFVGATTWENEQAFKAGVLATQEEYKRINFNQAAFYQQMQITAEREVYIRSQVITGIASADKESKAVIDKFFVPKDAIEELKKRANDILNILKELNGFVQTEVFERLDNAGNIVMFTITCWASQADMESARKTMMNNSLASEFNPAEFYEQHDITIDRGMYSISNN